MSKPPPKYAPRVEEKRERLELRPPASAKRDMEAAAKADGTSLAAWAERVLTRAARRAKAPRP